MSGPLARHLRSWLGAWPPTGPGVHVVGDPGRSAPTWDGRVRPLLGAVRPGDRADADAALLVTTPELRPVVADLVQGLPVDALRDDATAAEVGQTVAGEGAVLGLGVLRWATREEPVADADEVPDLGVWLPWDDPRVPAWLHPFGHEVLVALDEDGAYAAGVGVKHHDDTGHELSVVTAEAHRGKGWARRLVATAARRQLERVPVVTYLHDPANTASAHVADAVGLPERGWRVVGVFGGAGGDG